MNKEMASSLLSKVIKVDRGGPETNIGMLLGAEDDHITVLTESDGVVYYQTQHIKSITHDSKGGLEFDTVIPEEFKFIQEKDFKSVLGNLKYQWVKINRGGPEKLEGVLDEVTDDFLTIILNEEIIRVSMFHIRSISYGLKIEKEDAKKEDEKKASKNNNTAK
ncbi:hypothetical protein ACIQ4I_20670 [Rummeliibacillus sp. NPDC094406]|uniref:hypothetical protein n=1 Tax=Rummeliibacillus sp. NPDC094406 TaxID=3364511 RepID=UPI0038006C00